MRPEKLKNKRIYRLKIKIMSCDENFIKQQSIISKDINDLLKTNNLKKSPFRPLKLERDMEFFQLIPVINYNNHMKEIELGWLFWCFYVSIDKNRWIIYRKK